MRTKVNQKFKMNLNTIHSRLLGPLLLIKDQNIEIKGNTNEEENSVVKTTIRHHSPP